MDKYSTYVSGTPGTSENPGTTRILWRPGTRETPGTPAIQTTTVTRVYVKRCESVLFDKSKEKCGEVVQIIVW